MADSIPGDMTTTAVLQIDIPLDGEIETRGDEDWYRIDLEAGQGYFFEMAGNGLSPYTMRYATVLVLDSTGKVLRGGQTSRDFSDSGAIFNCLASGTYFISAGSKFDTEVVASIGTYRLAAVKLIAEVLGRAGDFDDGRAGATDLPLDDPQYALTDYGSESGGEHDWFRVSVEAGKAYYAEMDSAAFASYPNEDSILELYDAAGTRLGRSAWLDADGIRAGLSFTADANGSAYVVASSSDSGGLYSLTLRELPTLSFTAGADWLTLPVGVWAGLLDIRGGAGRDMMSFAGLVPGPERGIEVNLATGLARAGGAEAFSILLQGVENVTGTGLSDIFHGSAGAELMRGLGGRDTLFGSEGADSLQGGGGVDVADYIAAASGVSVSLLRGRGWAGDAAGDRLMGIENLRGSRHADTLWGDHAANRLDGSTGDDTITGNGGDDLVHAGAGTDVIVFSGNRADYTIATSGLRTDVTDSRGIDGHDILAHAEVLRFADGDWLL